jgi:hypothetical protein
MILTYKQIHKITFPAYRLPSDNWYSQDGLLFVDDILVDDKNMSGDTLGKRRLQTYFKDLLVLKRAVDNTTALIKQPGGPFIDSAGKCFLYEKTKFGRVEYFEIKDIDYRGNLCVLRAKGINSAFTIPRPPKPGFTWVGILHLDGLPWVLYEYAESKLDSIRRKV